MGRGGPTPSIMDRLLRRGRKEKEKEDATEDSGQRPRPSDEPTKEPGTDPQGDTDTASGDEAGDVLTISEGAGAVVDDANVSSDDANETDGDVLTISDGSTVVAGGDETVSSDDAAADEPGTGSEGDADTGTGNDTETGTATDDSSDGVVGEDDASQDSDVTNNDGSGAVDDNANVATGDGTQTGDVVDDGNQQAIDDNATGVTDGAQDSNIATGEGDVVNNGDIDDGTQTGDAIGGDENQQAIDDGGDIDTGTDGDDTGESQSIEGATEVENPIDLNLVRNARIGAPQESELAQELRQIKDATEPQLDPAVIEARLGGRGPQPPDPDGPDDLAFGKGATFETQQANPGVLINVDPDVPPEAPEGVPDDGFNDVGAEPDPGLDPAPPGSGLGPNEVQFDDPGPHDDPTEVDID